MKVCLCQKGLGYSCFFLVLVLRKNVGYELFWSFFLRRDMLFYCFRDSREELLMEEEEKIDIKVFEVKILEVEKGLSLDVEKGSL